MLWLRPFSWVNRNGSAAIASTGVKVNTANVVFTFKNHAFVFQSTHPRGVRLHILQNTEY